MSFNTLGLSSELKKAIEKKGYTNPSEIQLQAIPSILEGNDIMAGAQTGTGKTAAFALPILQKPAQRAWKVLLDSGSDGDIFFKHKRNGLDQRRAHTL